MSERELYVYELPYLSRKELCRVLDLSHDWKDLGGAHMGYPVFDILEIENECRRRGSSPSDSLLTKWGHQNHTVLELFVLLYKMQHHPAMTCLQSHVNPTYHCLLEQQFTSTGNTNGGVNSTNTAMSASDNNVTRNSPASQNCDEQQAVMQSSSKILNGPPHETMEDKTRLAAVANDVLAESAGALLMIPYSELSAATQNWHSDNILGKGGFGIVYKGDWKHTAVAIKQLKNTGDVNGVSDESLRELRYLNACRHDNVLPLYGYSVGGKEPCLIYQLMSGGSLEERIKCKYGRQPLTWKQRLNIAQGVAKGLQYLHTVSKTPLIHGDIKSANILLDANGEPRIGDFGLARQGPANDELTHMKVSRVHGTLPYLPNEFLRYQKFSVKVDTYSFGVVIFEMITGLSAYDKTRKHCFLKDHVVEFCKENPKDTADLQDARLVRIGETNPELCQRIIIVGVKCVHPRATDRPHMVEVWQDLVSMDYSE